MSAKLYKVKNIDTYIFITRNREDLLEGYILHSSYRTYSVGMFVSQEASHVEIAEKTTIEFTNTNLDRFNSGDIVCMPAVNIVILITQVFSADNLFNGIVISSTVKEHIGRYVQDYSIKVFEKPEKISVTFNE